LEVTYTRQFSKLYYLKDHLGNIRVTVDQAGVVKGYDDYYPFGLQMPGRCSNTANPNHLYKYSGKELDEEIGLNWYYFIARPYDPEIGRFVTVDPLSHLAPEMSPYHYTRNNPLNRIDPDGRNDRGLSPYFYFNVFKKDVGNFINYTKGQVQYYTPAVFDIASSMSGYIGIVNPLMRAVSLELQITASVMKFKNPTYPLYKKDILGDFIGEVSGEIAGPKFGPFISDLVDNAIDNFEVTASKVNNIYKIHTGTQSNPQIKSLLVGHGLISCHKSPQEMWNEVQSKNEEKNDNE